MPKMTAIVRSGFDRLDATTLPGLYTAVSIRAERTRTWLRVNDKAFVDPERNMRPEAGDLWNTAQWVTHQSRLRMAFVGGMAGLGGLASIPPEAMAQVVAGLRLAQRLAVVYGFDPNTDRGQLAVWQALAAGFEVSLPQDGPNGLRVSDLPSVMVKRPDMQVAAGSLATAVARSSAWFVARRLTRWLPMNAISSGLGARAADQRMRSLGERMAATLSRLAVPRQPADVVDAVEVG